MNPQHSRSLILIWLLANFEARRVNSKMIEPGHFLLALCKAVDVDLTIFVPMTWPGRDDILEETLREVRRLRTVYHEANFNARGFRRAFRFHCGSGLPGQGEVDQLHRSKESKKVFAEAERFAAIAESVVFPVHLLYAVLMIPDETRDVLLDQHGTEPKCLRTLAGQAVALPWSGKRPEPGLN